MSSAYLSDVKIVAFPFSAPLFVPIWRSQRAASKTYFSIDVSSVFYLHLSISSDLAGTRFRYPTPSFVPKALSNYVRCDSRVNVQLSKLTAARAHLGRSLILRVEEPLLEQIRYL